MLILISFLIVILLSGHGRVYADSQRFSHFFSHSYSALRFCSQGMTEFMLILIYFLISILIVILLSGHDRIYADSHFFSHSYSALRAWQGLC